MSYLKYPTIEFLRKIKVRFCGYWKQSDELLKDVYLSANISATVTNLNIARYAEHIVYAQIHSGFSILTGILVAQLEVAKSGVEITA